MADFFSGLSPAIYLEAAVIGLVFFLQLYFFIRTYKDIKIFKDIFDHPLRLSKHKISKKGKVVRFTDEKEQSSPKIDQYMQDIVLLDSESRNEINLEIKESINTYLVNNFRASVSYDIIMDIVEREVDAKDEEILQTIPIPLYLGLSATIIGIIFGLFGTNLEGDLSAINALIDGVKLAMFASLSGLVWTIILSSFLYKSAKKKNLKAKNKQLTYLQSQLLPKLLNTRNEATGGLQSSIDAFSRAAEDLIQRLRETAGQAQNVEQSEKLKSVQPAEKKQAADET